MRKARSSHQRFLSLSIAMAKARSRLCNLRNLPLFFILGLSCVALLSFSRWGLFQTPMLLDDPRSTYPNARTLLVQGIVNKAKARSGEMRVGSSSSSSSSSSISDGVLKLMLASHNRLFWYFPGDDTSVVLHEGQGVHYGVFPGELDPITGRLQSVWNVLRPHNWHPTSSEENLIELDVDTGFELQRKQIESRFTHDAVRVGKRVFVCSTGEGRILELAYPEMNMVMELPLFTRREHINTLSPVGETGDQLLVMLHNLGKSDVVKLSVAPGDAAASTQSTSNRIVGVGTKSHGLVQWRGWLILLDSENGALVGIPEYATADNKPQVFWKTPDRGKFLKGLAVLDDVAYFGISVWSTRSARGDEASDSELGAVDLNTRSLVFRRKVPTHGLLNIVAAPHLGEASTYRGMTSGTASLSTQSLTTASTTTATAPKSTATLSSSPRIGRDRISRIRSSTRDSISSTHGHSGSQGASKSFNANFQTLDVNARSAMFKKFGVEAVARNLLTAGWEPAVGGTWPSGLPYMSLEGKNSATPWLTGIQLPLKYINVSALQEAVRNLPEKMWDDDEAARSNALVDGRKDNMANFKPGCSAIYLVFSDRSTDHAFQLPYYKQFKDILDPIIKDLVGPNALQQIVRMQFARMPPEAEIKPHRDLGGYSHKAHRIHVPVITDGEVDFEICAGKEQSHKRGRKDMDDPDAGECTRINMEAGLVSEVNNVILHRVKNKSPVTRVHLVIDVAEDPRPTMALKPGTICSYVRGVVTCPEGSATPVEL